MHPFDGHDIKANSENGGPQRFGRCGYVDCNTRFGLAFDHSTRNRNHSFFMEFQIWRHLGPLRDVQDPMWVSQIENTEERVPAALEKHQKK
jgi:hypothetical protein